MEHTVAVGDVLAVWGTRNADGNERQYVIREHGEIGTQDCSCQVAHRHLTEITILTSGYTPITDVHLADELIIDGIRHLWSGRTSADFILTPAS